MLYLFKLAATWTSGSRRSIDRVGCPARLYSGRGQEGTHVGVAYALDQRDSLFPTHRDLTAQLAKGLDPRSGPRAVLGSYRRLPPRARWEQPYRDWEGNRTFAVMSHLPSPTRWRSARRGLPARRRRLGRAGDLWRRRDLQRPLARSAQHLGDHASAGGLGRQQQPVRLLHAGTPRIRGAHDRGARRRLRHARRAGGRTEVLEVYAAAREAVERARTGGGRR